MRWLRLPDVPGIHGGLRRTTLQPRLCGAVPSGCTVLIRISWERSSWQREPKGPHNRERRSTGEDQRKNGQAHFGRCLLARLCYSTGRRPSRRVVQNRKHVPRVGEASATPPDFHARGDSGPVRVHLAQEATLLVPIALDGGDARRLHLAPAA